MEPLTEPVFDIEVIGSKRKLAFRAIIDTGFTGELCLPVEEAIRLGLELVGQDEVELADGSRKQQLFFKGAVRLLDETSEVMILLTDGEDSLIGTELLKDCRLLINFPKNEVRLSRKVKKPKTK